MKYKMGDPHPYKDLVYYRLHHGKEKWVSPEELREKRLKANEYNRTHYKKTKSYYIEKARARKAFLNTLELSDLNREKIKKIYASAQDNQVDHIFPLIHSCFCGLHVPWNLQHLTSFENGSKGNKVEAKYYGILGDETLAFEKKRV